MEHFRLSAIWPTDNRLGTSLNQILGWTTVRELYSRALEQGPLVAVLRGRSRLSGQELAISPFSAAADEISHSVLTRGHFYTQLLLL